MKQEKVHEACHLAVAQLHQLKVRRLMMKAVNAGGRDVLERGWLVVAPKIGYLAQSDVFRHDIEANKEALWGLFTAYHPSDSEDGRKWVSVARHVLCGEFEGCDAETAVRLFYGLRMIDSNECWKAADVLYRMTLGIKQQYQERPFEFLVYQKGLI
jgi:hypothetical protein